MPPGFSRPSTSKKASGADSDDDDEEEYEDDEEDNLVMPCLFSYTNDIQMANICFIFSQR